MDGFSDEPSLFISKLMDPRFAGGFPGELAFADCNTLDDCTDLVETPGFETALT